MNRRRFLSLCLAGLSAVALLPRKLPALWRRPDVVVWEGQEVTLKPMRYRWVEVRGGHLRVEPGCTIDRLDVHAGTVGDDT